MKAATEMIWVIGKRAFTIMELVVVIAIIGVVVMLGAPALSRYANEMRLKTATREVVGLLSLARTMAISSHASRTVVVDPDQGQLIIEETVESEPSGRLQLPQSIEIVVETHDGSSMPEGDWRLAFQPSGALSGRSVSVVLSSPTRSQTVSVTAATGFISVQ